MTGWADAGRFQVWTRGVPVHVCQVHVRTATWLTEFFWLVSMKSKIQIWGSKSTGFNFQFFCVTFLLYLSEMVPFLLLNRLLKKWRNNSKEWTTKEYYCFHLTELPVSQTGQAWSGSFRINQSFIGVLGCHSIHQHNSNSRDWWDSLGNCLFSSPSVTKFYEHNNTPELFSLLNEMYVQRLRWFSGKLMEIIEGSSVRCT